MALQKLRLTALNLFGRFPKTEDLERKDKELREEYQEFLRFKDSEEYKNFLELKAFVDSGEPQRAKIEYNKIIYKNSDEYKSESEYLQLKKRKQVRNYFLIKDSQTLADYNSVELSGKPIQFLEYKEAVESPEYRNLRKEHKKNNSEEYQKELAYHQLRKDSDVKKYFRLKKWKPLIDYFELEGSDTIARYFELENYITSSEFIDRKKYLLSKNKYEHSEAFKKLSEFNSLKKSKKIIWFNSVVNSNKFDEIKRWELTFNDEFNDNRLNTGVWLTRYFWGEALLNTSYSLSGDLNAFSNGKNIQISDSILKIKTVKEKADGLAWDQKFGFAPKSFDYTSGIINTGQSFRQLYGRFEAKIKFAMVPGVYHSFWLVGDKMLPHIDIVRQNGAKSPSVQGSIYWQDSKRNKPNKQKSSIGGFNFNSNFYILGVDWSPTKMVWKINGIPFFETDKNLPNAPVYIVLSSGVLSNPIESNLPATLEVDWVRCWRDTKLAKSV
jgi:beta-glucanase (GH16 family)